jgi:AcrR family transcriptional regulator
LAFFSVGFGYVGFMPKTGLTAVQIRDKAIDVAIVQMRRHGFEKVRLVDIAKDLGVSHAALYIHFADKAALLDAVSERWLKSLEAALERVCQKNKDPIAKIHEWFLKLYQMKRRKVMNDPELYKAFKSVADQKKTIYEKHLAVMNGQLTEIVKSATAQKRLAKHSIKKTVELLFETTTGFHNPTMIARHPNENRENLLKQVLDVVLVGLSMP